MKRIFNRTAHKALWDWLSKNLSKGKRDWPGWTYNGGEYETEREWCFACGASESCDNCVLNWPYRQHCSEDNSLYRKFYDSEGQVRAEGAIRIRDLDINKFWIGDVI